MKGPRVMWNTIPYLFMALIINFAIFSGFSFTFNIQQTGLYYMVLLLVSFSHPVSLVLLTRSSNLLVRTLYAVSAAWTGMVAYILIMFAVYLILGFFINIPAYTAGIVILLVAFVVTVYAIINVTRLKVEEITIPLNIENNIRAVQISDVHIGPIRKQGFLRRMMDKIIDLNPDIVFITGDLFDGSSKLEDNILKDFKRIKAPILFVMGNHDFYQGRDQVSDFVSGTPINILYNEVLDLQDLQVVGVPFYWDRHYLQKTLPKINFDRDKPTILLYHLPSEFKVAKAAGIDLQLSGHTHAGQFFPFNYFVRLPFPYIRGLYGDEGGYLYVSQGTGTLGPPMRLGSRCEITLIKLVGGKSIS